MFLTSQETKCFYFVQIVFVFNSLLTKQSSSPKIMNEMLKDIRFERKERIPYLKSIVTLKFSTQHAKAMKQGKKTIILLTVIYL